MYKFKSIFQTTFVVLFFCFSFNFPQSLLAQNTDLLPVKQGGKWGMINQYGKVIIPLQYEAIGTFKEGGIAVVQKNNKMGVINTQGKLIIPIEYIDIKIISPFLFSIYENNSWNIINQNRKKILDQYNKIELLQNEYLVYWKDVYCGLIHIDGRKLINAEFDQIKIKKSPNKQSIYFEVYKNEELGIIDKNGEFIAPVLYREIKPINNTTIVVKSKYKWGLIDNNGNELLSQQYSDYKKLNNNWIVFSKQEKSMLYSIRNKTFINANYYKEIKLLNNQYFTFQKNLKIGLLNHLGIEIIPDEYQEIYIFNNDLFRIKKDNKWGIINTQNKELVPPVLDYIAPLNQYAALVRKGKFFGIIDDKGKLVLNTVYDKIEIKGEKIKAWKGEQLSMYTLNQNGFHKVDEFNHFTNIKIKNKNKAHHHEFHEGYQLDGFEWFWDNDTRKWGLRDISNGQVKIQPTFDFIEVKRRYNFTLVGIYKTVVEDYNGYKCRFSEHFGIMDNSTGNLVCDIYLRNIHLEDFDNGLPSARVVFDNGTHGLINKKGIKICGGYNYIGSSHEGLAIMAIKGRLGTKKTANSYPINNWEDYLSENTFGKYHKDAFYKDNPMVYCQDCSWGYIDTLGRLMIPPNYSAALDFKNGQGIVKLGDKWGSIDKDAREIIPCIYDFIERFEKDKDLLHLQKNTELSGIIHPNGEMISNSIYQQIGPLKEGLIPVKKANLWGFINEKGEIIIKPKYKKISLFSEGKAAIYQNGDWGFINKEGEVIIKPQYAQVGNFNSGLVWVSTSKGYGYINEKNQMVIEPQFRKAFDFQDGIARVKDKDNVRLINLEGTFISNNSYDDLSPFNAYGIAIALSSKANIRYYLVNKEGEKVGLQNFPKIYPFSQGLAAFQKDGKFGFINVHGEVVVDNIYDKVSQFSEGKAWVKKDGHCGYINQMGSVVVDLAFSKCQDFEDGKAVVYKNAKKGGLLDSDGEVLIRPSLNRFISYSEGKGLVSDYDDNYYYVKESGEIYEGYFNNAKTFEDGTAFVELNGQWGLINDKGIFIIPPKYKKMERMSNGLIKVYINQQHGICTSSGEMIVPVQHEKLSYLGNQVIRIEQGSKIGYVKTDGTWIWGLQN